MILTEEQKEIIHKRMEEKSEYATNVEVEEFFKRLLT